jgi:hypothetical protein
MIAAVGAAACALHPPAFSWLPSPGCLLLAAFTCFSSASQPSSKRCPSLPPRILSALILNPVVFTDAPPASSPAALPAPRISRRACRRCRFAYQGLPSPAPNTPAALRFRQYLPSSSLPSALAITPSSRILLVLAHPDDESMFFAPAIAHLLRAAASVHLLCLSTGNYNGLGALRSSELRAASRVLRLSGCTIIDDAELQDGPNNPWPPAAIARRSQPLILQPCSSSHVMSRVSEAALLYRASHILTFDSGGVSAHPNHVDTHTACAAFARDSPHIRLLTLRTSPLLLKCITCFISCIFVTLCPCTSASLPSCSPFVLPLPPTPQSASATLRPFS